MDLDLFTQRFSLCGRLIHSCVPEPKKKSSYKSFRNTVSDLLDLRISENDRLKRFTICKNAFFVSDLFGELVWKLLKRSVERVNTPLW